jgi:hypothetical protein
MAYGVWRMVRKPDKRESVFGSGYSPGRAVGREMQGSTAVHAQHVVQVAVMRQKFG